MLLAAAVQFTPVLDGYNVSQYDNGASAQRLVPVWLLRDRRQTCPVLIGW
jgi:hypothetical protein